MDIDLSNTVEMDSRTDRNINSQTILKPPEKPPSPTYNYRQNHVTNVILAGVPIVCLFIDGKERLCLAQISNTLLKAFSYNEIHNRRVALGITCVQCTPVQLEILRRAGAMPISSRRCGMITKREAERLVKSFLEDNTPPKLPENFYFEVEHNCGWGCRGRFEPSRYNSSRAKCIKCTLCNLFFSPNKFIFHFHRTPESKYNHPDAANFNSWRRHLTLVPGTDTEDIMHAWEDVKAMFNGGSRKRTLTTPSSRFSSSVPTTVESKKPKLHMDSAGHSKQTFPSQYPNYSMFSVPNKAYPFAPLAAHNQLGITFPFVKDASPPEPVKPSQGFGHTPWRSSSNFLFPSYDLLWANHFNMGTLNTPMTSFRPNIYETPTVKDLSLFSVDRHSPSDSANSTEDDEQELSPVGNTTPATFNQINQRLSAFKPVHKSDGLKHSDHVDIESVDDTQTAKEKMDKAELSESCPQTDKDFKLSDDQLNVSNVHDNRHNDTVTFLNSDISRSNGNVAIDTKIVEVPTQTKEDKRGDGRVFDNNNEDDKIKNTNKVEKNHNSLDVDSLIQNKTTTPTEDLTEKCLDKGSDTDTRNQVEKTIDKIQGSLHDRSMIEKSQKDEIAQQLQLLKDALCSELEQERQIRFSMQQKLKEAHDALHNFSCTILSTRQCSDFTNKDKATNIQQ